MHLCICRVQRQTGRWEFPLQPPSSVSYLQVSGSLEGLVTDGTDVAAVLPVGLSAVPAQRVGVLAHLVAVVTLVTAHGF